jgi:hypothetical protein
MAVKCPPNVCQVGALFVEGAAVAGESVEDLLGAAGHKAARWRGWQTPSVVTDIRRRIFLESGRAIALM